MKTTIEKQNQRIYFVGGVFGAGKSTLAQQLAPLLPAKHVIASELLRYAAKEGDDTKKAVEDVDANQIRIIQALARVRKDNEAILLDGHYCLLRKSDEIRCISIETFFELSPCSLLLVEADPEVIESRLRARGQHLPLDLIKRLTAAEAERAEYVAERLGLKLVRWSSAKSLDQTARELVR